jgi:hypothetical protein
VNACAVPCVCVVCGTGTDECSFGRIPYLSSELSEYGGTVGEVMDVESSGYVLVAWQGAALSRVHPEEIYRVAIEEEVEDAVFSFLFFFSFYSFEKGVHPEAIYRVAIEEEVEDAVCMYACVCTYVCMCTRKHSVGASVLSEAL